MYVDRLWVKFSVCPKWHQLYRDYKTYRHFDMVKYESKRYYADIELEKEFGFKFVRRERNPCALSAWSYDKQPTCVDTKSWKKLYKVKKQYLKPKYYHERYFTIISE